MQHSLRKMIACWMLRNLGNLGHIQGKNRLTVIYGLPRMASEYLDLFEANPHQGFQEKRDEKY